MQTETIQIVAKQDMFGNAIPFVPLTKEQPCPADEVGKGPLLTKTDSDGTIHTLQLDVIHIARGGADGKSNKGFRYWGKLLPHTTEQEAEDSVIHYIGFYGNQHVAAILERTVNVENQKFCREIADKDALIKSLSEREVRGESVLAQLKDAKSIAEKMKTISDKTSKEYLELMTAFQQATLKAMGL